MGRTQVTQSEGLFDLEPVAPVRHAIDADIIGSHFEQPGVRQPPLEVRTIPPEPTHETFQPTNIQETETQLTITPPFLNDSEVIQYERLHALEGLLKLFGGENMGENYRVQFDSRTEVRETVLEAEGLNSEAARKESDNNVVKDELEGRQMVVNILGLGALVKAEIMTDKQAGAIRDATYDHYREQYGGIQNARDRKNALRRVKYRMKRIREQHEAAA